MTTLDKIKGAAKLIGSGFLFGEEVSRRQEERLQICMTSGLGRKACHNLKLVDSPIGKTPRCCVAGEAGCAPNQNGCGCFLMAKTKYEDEHCPLKRW